MKKIIISWIILYGVLSQAASQAAPPKLTMLDADSAIAIYEDTCANGGSNDKTNFDNFITAMLANPASKLSKLKVSLLVQIKSDGEEPRGEGVYIGDWTATYHDRDGCGSSHNSKSAFIMTVTGGNSNHTVTKYLATVSDNVDGAQRILKLEDIRAIKLTEEN